MIARIRPLLSIALSGLLVLSACGKNDGSASSNTITGFMSCDNLVHSCES